jgi:TLD
MQPEGNMAIYGATMDNTYFVFCDQDGIGFGSEPHAGLYIDHSLQNGSSHACKTYTNDQLSDETHFRIHRLEVWGFRLKNQL